MWTSSVVNIARMCNITHIYILHIVYVNVCGGLMLRVDFPISQIKRLNDVSIDRFWLLYAMIEPFPFLSRPLSQSLFVCHNCSLLTAFSHCNYKIFTHQIYDLHTFLSLYEIWNKRVHSSSNGPTFILIEWIYWITISWCTCKCY